jgi:hypothetical protein
MKAPKLTENQLFALSILRDGGSIVVPDEENVVCPAFDANDKPICHSPSKTQTAFKRETIGILMDHGLITSTPTTKYRGVIARLTESGEKLAATLPPTQIIKISTRRCPGS